VDAKHAKHLKRKTWTPHQIRKHLNFQKTSTNIIKKQTLEMQTGMTAEAETTRNFPFFKQVGGAQRVPIQWAAVSILPEKFQGHA
jgi:hypothetical protein